VLCDSEERVVLNDLYNDSSIESDIKIGKVKSIFDKTGVQATVELLMQDYYNKAINCLESIDVVKERKSVLLDLSDSLFSRNY
jgi:geranylgeranyl pyrophosphate synthase